MLKGWPASAAETASTTVNLTFAVRPRCIAPIGADARKHLDSLLVCPRHAPGHEDAHPSHLAQRQEATAPLSGDHHIFWS